MESKTDKQSWNSYYMYNDEALALIKTWREAGPLYKEKILSELIRRLSYMVQARIKYYRAQSFYIDLLQEGRMGLVKAIEDFDSMRGINFFKFASWHVRSRINNYLRWWRRTKCDVEVGPSNFNFNNFTPQDQFERVEESKILLKAINSLPEIDRKVVMMRYGVGGHKNHTLKQIGETFSLSKQRIQQIEFRAIEKLGKFQEIKNLF